MFQRKATLPERPRESFFLWGPRQTGKTSLLRSLYPDARRIDLLETDRFIRYVQRPALLREELSADPAGTLVVIDEVQKVPLLLDEVHALIENRRLVFALCGSSARRLKRGQANLLGGRAERYQLLGLVSSELDADFELSKTLNHGYLPRHYTSPNPRRLLLSYVNDYLKEEIAAEGLVRNLPAFSEFLSAAALSDSEMVNYSTIARDCGVSHTAIREYFQILVDTLQGSFLPAYRKRPKRRVVQTSKFYFADVGVVNHLARRGTLEPKSELFGKAFENWVHHELRAYCEYSGRHDELSYWRLAGGTEVDFIVNDMEIAIEAKAVEHVSQDHLKGLRSIVEDHRRIRRRVAVSLDTRQRRTDDGIDVLPYKSFVDQLWSGRLY